LARYGVRLGAAVIGLGLLGAGIVEANAGGHPSALAGATLTAKTTAARTTAARVLAADPKYPGPAAGARGPRGGFGHPGFPGGGFAGGGVVGTVASVSGSDFTVTVTFPSTSTTTKSTTVKVATSSSTTFEVESASTLSAVAPGDTVVVSGTRTSSGGVTASQITVLPTSAASQTPGAGGWGALEGTVSTVTSGSLTLKTASGSVTVTTPTSTKVDTVATATAASLAVGDQVIVEASRPAQPTSPTSGSGIARSVAASRVLLAPAGTTLADPAGPGGFGAGPGGFGAGHGGFGAGPPQDSAEAPQDRAAGRRDPPPHAEASLVSSPSRSGGRTRAQPDASLGHAERVMVGVGRS